MFVYVICVIIAFLWNTHEDAAAAWCSEKNLKNVSQHVHYLKYEDKGYQSIEFKGDEHKASKNLHAQNSRHAQNGA
jgi:hypothetical protein